MGPRPSCSLSLPKTRRRQRLNGAATMNPCPTGKQPYPSVNAAWRVIQLLTHKTALHTHKRHGKAGGYAYRCQECGQWHMTSQHHRESLKGRPRQWLEEAQG